METDIKRNWIETRFKNPSDKQREEILNGQRQTALQRLAKKYLHFSNMALLMIVCVPLLVTMVLFEHTDTTLKLIWVLFTTIYFALCCIIDRKLYYGIKSIDCATMTVEEVSSRAMHYRKRHLQSILLLAPLALVTIGGMAYLTEMSTPVLFGIITGAVLGLTIGTIHLMKFMSYYRTINRQ